MTRLEKLIAYWNVEKTKKSIESYQENISFWRKAIAEYEPELTEDNIIEIIRIIKSNESLIEGCKRDIAAIIGEYHGEIGTPIETPFFLIEEDNPKKGAVKKAKTT